jgi:uncharacterized protein (UPF0303 family)
MPVDQVLKAIAEQEEQLVFDRFDEGSAWTLGGLIRAQAVKSCLPIVIDIRLFSRPLLYFALAGSSPDNREWARRKGNVVERFHRSSYAVGLKNKHAGTTLLQTHGLNPADYADHGGAFPIKSHAFGVIGSITVSGLPQHEDHGLVVSSVCELLGMNPAKLQLPPIT